MSHLIIGIDPGKTGAIAVLGPDGQLRGLLDMPIINGEVDATGLAGVLVHLEAPCVTFVEKVHSMPKQGVKSTFSFGQNYGTILGVIGTLQLPLVKVRPQDWKPTFRLTGKDKDASRQLALEMWPEARDELRLKKHGGRADAALIAEHGRRSLRVQSTVTPLLEDGPGGDHSGSPPAA